MSENLMKYVLAIFFVCGFSAGCANAQIVPKQEQPKNELPSNMNLSNDEAVLAELQKITDSKNAKRANGDEKIVAEPNAVFKLEAKDVCIKRIKEAKIIVVGFFRTDYGCHLEGIFVGSRYFEREESDLSKIALAALGWEKATKNERENLANIWVEKGLLVFAPLPYQSLSAISTGDGSVKVTASSQYPAGVTSRTISKTFIFGKDGALFSGTFP